ncbi:hypothetical protein RRG08_029342 [Elysia crispata]|uniref:Uncharacterized protein n=1 Tax=Elysia crispata TaxID=231223 RepID=A0AAE1E426_9GAST|nr:hypothetical protein RRG08_029342 [Elysia crispata]
MYVRKVASPTYLSVRLQASTSVMNINEADRTLPQMDWSQILSMTSSRSRKFMAFVTSLVLGMKQNTQWRISAKWKLRENNEIWSPSSGHRGCRQGRENGLLTSIPLVTITVGGGESIFMIAYQMSGRLGTAAGSSEFADLFTSAEWEGRAGVVEEPRVSDKKGETQVPKSRDNTLNGERSNTSGKVVEVELVDVAAAVLTSRTAPIIICLAISKLHSLDLTNSDWKSTKWSRSRQEKQGLMNEFEPKTSDKKLQWCLNLRHLSRITPETPLSSPRPRRSSQPPIL